MRAIAVPIEDEKNKHTRIKLKTVREKGNKKRIGETQTEMVRQ